MKERTRTIGAVRLLWPLVLGLGMVLGLLWAIVPRAVVEAQSRPLGFAVVQAASQQPAVVAHYRMDGSNDVWGGGAIPGNPVYITVTHPISGVIATGTTYAGTAPWAGPNGYRLDFPDGTIVPNNAVHVDFGSGFVYSTTVVSIMGRANPDTDVVTVTAPISSWVYMNANDPYDNLWESEWSYENTQVEAAGYVTFDLSVDGFDILPGTNFNVHVEDTQYTFWLSAPELSVDKWNVPSYARPGGVVVYGISYWNNGNGVATDTLIVDTLPANTSWAGDTSGVVAAIGAGGVITWNLGNVEPGSGSSFMVTLDVFGLSNGDTIDPNCVTITTITPGDYDPGNNGPRCAGPVDVWDDDVEVGVEKGPNPGDPMPGQEFEYDIQPCNHRGAAAGPLWLTDTLPLSTTFVSWSSDSGDATYWTEVVTAGGQVVLYAPGLPGDVCENLHFRLLLDPDVPVSTTLENTIAITAADDVYPDNNGPHVNAAAHASGPRYDMNANKWYNNGVLAPGGWIEYSANYWNAGNTAIHAWMTDTLSAGTSYRPGSGSDHKGEPFEPAQFTADYVVWDLGVVPVNDGFGFNFTLNISDALPASTDLVNCVTVGITETEDTPWDNTSCVTETVYAPGPNLYVTKESNYGPGNDMINYRIYFGNYGDQTVYDAVITDTLPISTTYDWHNVHWWGSQYTATTSASELVIVFERMEPGWSSSIDLGARLDDPGARLRWYTNTVEITTLPNDVNPNDNFYEDVVFSGGEVDRVDLDLYRTRIWGCAYSTPITITSAQAQMVIDWNNCWDEEFGDTFDPGDVVTVTAGAATHPVVIHIPDSFTAYASSITDTVWGQIDGAYFDPVDVDLWGFPTEQAQTDGNGNYSATFPDVPRGAQGHVNYRTEIDYANVTFHHRFQTSDLILRVNYGHDWVQGNYEAGHTVWVTVTESDGSTVKATASETTGPLPWGDIGFHVDSNDWGNVDLVPGDWVFGTVDNGYTSTARVGIIIGSVDAGAGNGITGTVEAAWLVQTETVDVDCEAWGSPGEAPSKRDSVLPDGVDIYECTWDPSTEWDVEPGQDIAVFYWEPDQDQVGNVFREPQPYLTVNKGAGGNPAEGGNFVFNIGYSNGSGDSQNYAENVVITDTLLGGMTYLADTSGLPHTGTGAPGDPIVWDVGTVPGSSGGNFDVFVQITAGEGENITNTVEIATSSPYNQSSPEERISEWNGTVQANDTWLNVGKWIDGPNPAPGTDFDWIVSVCNGGSTSSSEVTVTDTLPISTTLLGWWGDSPGWTEVLNTSGQLVVSYPSIADGQCTAAYLRFHLDENAWIGMWISNTATISASNDLTDTDNMTTDWRDIYGPYSNLYVRKDWLHGQLVAGGELYYGVHFGNDGNAPADDVLITYTLPVSTSFNRAWRNTPSGPQPVMPATVTADYVVFDLDTLENGEDDHIEIALDVDSDASPGTTLTSTLEITPHPTDYHHDDNVVGWVETLNPTGPNLEVHKQNYWWNGTGQIGYEMRVKNRGTERLEPVWITDTYPISTIWDGNWWYGHGPWITTTHDASNRQIIFWLEYLDPGETASIQFQVDLDGAIHGTQGLFFTNTLEAPVSGDVYQADNYDKVIAYAGPDVYVEKWLKGGESRPGEVVTFTVKFGNRNGWGGMDGGYYSTITDALPAAMTFITSTTPWDPNQWWHPQAITGATSVRWGWSTPWANSDWYFVVVAQITDTVQSGDVITNTVEYHDDNPNNLDLSSDNDIFELAVTILNPMFEVGKVYEGDVAGTVVTYTLTVTNVGNYPGTNVVLSDTVPAYLEDVSSGGTLDLGWLWWHLATIAPDGGTATARFSATLPCTQSLRILNDDYGVRSSDQGVSGPAGAPVSFAVSAPTISAGFTHTLGTIVTGDTVAFTGTASTDGTGLSYEWGFGDGLPMGGGLTATHVYTQDGVYTVAFTATDACGYYGVPTATVTVAPSCIQVISVTFDHAPANPAIQTLVVYTAAVLPSNADTPVYTWDFGDGYVGSGRVVSHSYALRDTYTVVVTATNCMGAGIVTYTEEVVVTLVDGAQAAVDPTMGGTLIYTDTQGNPTTVRVPGGATTQTITLLLTPVASPTQPVSPSLRFINHTFDLEAYVGNRPVSGYVFSKPVTITVQYSDADVAGVDEGTLRLHYWTGSVWDDAANTCTPPSTYTRNLVQNLLGVPICHLSRYSVLGESLHTIYLPVVLRES